MTTRDLRATLTRLQAELARAPRIDESSRRLLQQVMQAAQAVIDRPPPQQPATALDRTGLETLAVQFETEHPDLSAGIRQFLDVLTKGGL